MAFVHLSREMSLLPDYDFFTVNVAVPREEGFIYPTNTSNKCAFYGVKGEDCSAIGVTDELPLHDQMPNLNVSPQWLILHWIGQVREAKSLRVLEA